MDTTVLIIFGVEFIMVTILILLTIFRLGPETGAASMAEEGTALENEITDPFVAYLDAYYWGWF
jgi:hypothetical protein